VAGSSITISSDQHVRIVGRSKRESSSRDLWLVWDVRTEPMRPVRRLSRAPSLRHTPVAQRLRLFHDAYSARALRPL